MLIALVLSYAMVQIADNLSDNLFLENLFRVILALTFTIFLVIVHKRSFDDYGFNGNIDRKNLGMSILWGIVFGVVLIIIGVTDDSLVPNYQNNLILDILAIGLFASISEETLIRGFLNSELLILSKKKIKYFSEAGVLSAFVFGLFHLKSFPYIIFNEVALLFCPAFIFGLVLSRLREDSKGLLSPIICHFIANLVEVLFRYTRFV